MVILKKRKRLLSFIMSLVLVCSATMFLIPEKQQVSAENATVAGLRQQKEAAEQRSAELQTELSNAQAAESSALQTKKYFDDQVSATAYEIYTTELLIEQLNVEIENLNASIARTREDIKKKESELRANIKATYQDERITYLEMLFNSTSFKDFLTNLDRAGVMLNYRNNLVQELNDQYIKLNEERAAKEEYYKEKEAEEEELKANKVKLEEQQAAATAAYHEAVASAEAAEAAVEENNALIAQKVAELDALIAQIKAQQQAASRSSGGGSVYQPDGSVASNVSATGYRWPVDNSWSYVSCYFGVGGHRGIDIPASMGSNVYASQSGTVVTSEYHYSWGNYVLIRHDDGNCTLYAHNSVLCVVAGETVVKGQVIAKIGSTGNSTGPHCHFEFWVGGSGSNLANPLNFFSASST